MKAMIFAAGVGTRLKPITDTRPKALAIVAGKPLLQWNIEKLKRFGFDEILINVHHFPDQIINFISGNKSFGIRIEISDESDLLLETGGGLKKASWFFDDGKDFLLCNADILSNIDIEKFRQFHESKKPLASLAVTKRHSSRHLVFDDKGFLCGWENENTGEKKFTRKNTGELIPFSFSGIEFVSPEIFQHVKRDGVFSIIDVYLDLAGEFPILAYDHNGDTVLDVGKPEQLKVAEEFLQNRDKKE